MLPALATLLFTAFLLTPVVIGAAAVADASPATMVYPAWFSRVSPGVPGAFAPPRTYEADYRITWGGLEAARADVKVVSTPDSAELRTSLKASTTGLARTLYKLDATHLSVIDRRTFRPQYLEQTEQGSTKYTSTRVEFNGTGATRRTRNLNKSESLDANFRKPRTFAYPGLFDMEGVLLHLRSQPLADGDESTLLLMTSGSPYLATVKVVGHGAVHVKAGDFSAIECSLKLEKVAKNSTLEPRKGFKSAHAWLSDDADRLLLKAQSEVFVGTVNLELEKVSFTDSH